MTSLENVLQRLIPYCIIGRFDIKVPFESPTSCGDTFVEIKAFAALIIAPNARGKSFQSDVEKQVHALGT